MNLSELYRQVILDHSQHPRNFRTLDDTDAGTRKVDLRNPTCGDEITLYLTIRDGLVQKAAFQGTGCSISMSSASMLTEAVKGKNIATVLRLNDEFRKLVQGLEADGELLGDLEALAGVAAFPARIKCALLAWNALEKGVSQTQQRGREEHE
jgi:nitrogen fixation NifU-like protein